MMKRSPTPETGGWPQQIRRRGFLLGLSVGFAATSAQALSLPTPAQSEGPFYPDRLPDDQDNDLTRLMEAEELAQGEVLHLSGQLMNAEGVNMNGGEVEIWQCDAGGRYLHSGDRQAQPRDGGFQGYGRMQSDPGGGWFFRTIRPVAYPGRTPHIHIKAHHPNGRVLTTQLYIEGEADNDRDGLYRRLSEEEQALVTIPLTRDAAGEWRGSFSIVLPWI